MEVYYIDIGRGTSNAILIGQRRAIVIDCGEDGRALIQLLKHFQIETITRLIVSQRLSGIEDG